ncbi:1,4-dihydroxy-6-naphtoate synthase [Rubripirellula lacrimiformis]|uniref:1,4-dihydroxy-6-naphtoate synthase n=1 Tax=Rubripirellula lacrimiformis TaxID=1930273 RepID=A0A517NG10_9BACT|nr:1,4-dihydroxy-6-naphthoate synthase [Rubripirellula lacrimiformis]QDT06074.1 1,4-dihydroxy-6-naphtoate synthase [Rubripirellula lacrimiformis]
MTSETQPGDRRQTIRLGISTCPNDTFAFSALIDQRVDWRGLNFEIDLIDIQQLNDRLFRGDFDVAKTSFHAALRMTDTTVVLPSGSALGFGVGPLLLAASPQRSPGDFGSINLCPGQHTTAALLFTLFYPDAVPAQHCVFSDIMPRLVQGTADFGVCIHEGRFTWADQGLHLVEDLGTRWEQATDSPLPLGGIVANRALGDDIIGLVQSVIHDSLRVAMADPASALQTMRQYAQEMADDVLMQHVDLYVNQWTIDLGDVGRESLNQLSRMAAKIGLTDPGARSIEVWSPTV